VTVTVQAGQAVLVHSEITEGTTVAAGASGLRLWICYQPAGGTLTQAHAIDWIQVAAAANSVNIYPLMDTITGLGTGTYTVGICGNVQAASTDRNRQDWSHTTAEVIGGATIVASPNSAQSSERSR